MEVGNRIREEREKLGLSQEDMARQIFVSRQTISNWETGKTYPDVQSLLLLSGLFGVSVDSLVKGDVEAMDKQVENYELDRFKVKASMALAVALLAVGAVMLAILVAQGEPHSSPLVAIALLLLVSAIPVSFVAERIERRYDIDTLREVRAFLSGAEPDQIARERKISKPARALLEALAGAAVATAFMVLVSVVIALTMFD